MKYYLISKIPENPCIDCPIKLKKECRLHGACRTWLSYADSLLNNAVEVQTVGKVFHQGQWCLLIPESYLKEKLGVKDEHKQ